MPNRLTKGKGLFGSLNVTGTATVGDIAFSASGQPIHLYSATVARTNTAAKALFTLPANFVVTALRVYSPTASDAATTATLSVGKSGSQTGLLNALDVKGSTGAGQQTPSAATLGTIGSSAYAVTGIYAETGTASTTGGPWTVIVEGTTS